MHSIFYTKGEILQIIRIQNWHRVKSAQQSRQCNSVKVRRLQCHHPICASNSHNSIKFYMYLVPGQNGAVNSTSWRLQRWKELCWKSLQLRQFDSCHSCQFIEQKRISSANSRAMSMIKSNHNIVEQCIFKLQSSSFSFLRTRKDVDITHIIIFIHQNPSAGLWVGPQVGRLILWSVGQR